MTVAIAAIVPGTRNHIVVASDARLSYGDFLPATDDAMLKTRLVASKWGILFAASDTTAAQPVLAKLRVRLGYTEEEEEDQEHDLPAVREAAKDSYAEEFSDRFCSEYLSRLGYSDISQFRKDGFQELGRDLYHEYAIKLAKFDLGLELLAYGFDTRGNAHIFRVDNPGKITHHDMLDFAAIGSGSTQAYASLTRKRLESSLEEVVYRLLDAKFSSETAWGVGKTTHVVIMGRDGTLGFLSPDEVNEVRQVWERILKRRSPATALNIIAGSKGVRQVTEESTDAS